MRPTIATLLLSLWAAEASAVCVFFEHAGFRGRAFALQPGQCAAFTDDSRANEGCGRYERVEVSERFNDLLSSVIVADGAAAFMWQHVEGPLGPANGWMRFVGRSVPDASSDGERWNDEVTVVRCWHPSLMRAPGR